MKHIIILLFIFSITKIFAFNTFVRQYNTFSERYPQEKVFLHLDNNAYYIGEKIWYKAYVTNAQTLKPLGVSRVLYVDLLTQEGVFVKRNRHYISDNGTCDGCMELTDTSYNAGYYEIRAYTAWMLNFYDPFDEYLYETVTEKIFKKYTQATIYRHFRQEECPGIFSRVVPVYEVEENGLYERRRMRNRSRVGTGSKINTEKQVTATFYPEGGHVLKNTLGRIAFELYNPEGKHISPVCYITSGKDTISKTSIYSRGRGIITLDERYWKTEDKKKLSFSYSGRVYNFDIPVAEDYGVSLVVDNIRTDSVLSVVIYSRFQQQDSLLVALCARGRCNACEMVKIENDSLNVDTIYFSKTNLSEGINQISIVNGKNILLSERLIFHTQENRSRVIAKIQSDSLPFHENLLPYQPLECTVSIYDENNERCTDCNLSVSVRDDFDAGLTYNAGNIWTSMLLSSDIKGFVENPEYYFESDDEVHRRDLDLLLMVQGWKRYDWRFMSDTMLMLKNQEDVVAEFPTHRFYYPESGLSLKGDFYSWQKKFRNKPVVLRCIIDYYNKYYSDTAYWIDDKFDFPLPQIYGTHNISFFVYESWEDLENDNYIPVYYKQSAKSGQWSQRFSIRRERIMFPKPKQYSYYESTGKESDDFLYSDSYSTLLSDVLVEKKRRIQNIHKSRPIVRYPYDEFIDFVAPGNSYMNKIQIVSALYGLYQHSAGRLKEYCYLTDGTINYFDAHANAFTTFVNATYEPVWKYKYIEWYWDVFDRQRYIEPYSFEYNMVPVINWVTNPTLQYSAALPCYSCKLYGYTPRVEFYSPDYSTQPLPEHDYRRTLYWNPLVQTDSTGRVQINCYNNSTAKGVVIEVNGMTQDGRFIVGKDRL